MPENMDAFNNDMTQLNQLMHVINQITAKQVPLYKMHELTSKSTLRELQYAIDDLNALDDSDLIDTLNQVRIEIKYLVSIVNDLRERIRENEIEIARLERLAAQS